MAATIGPLSPTYSTADDERIDIRQLPVAFEAIDQDAASSRYRARFPNYVATTPSKFLHLGLTLEQAIKRVTKNPSRVFGNLNGLGTLREGAEADVAVFALEEGDFDFFDAMGQKRVGHRKLRPVATVKAGKIYGSASIPSG